MRTVILSIESINVFVWIVILLFSTLFLDSPTAKFSHLAPIYIPLIFGIIILLLSLFVFKTNALLIVGFILTLASSAPVVFYISSKTSNVPKSTISDRKPFVLEAGYTSIIDYLQKNDGKEVTINGKLFISEKAIKLSVNRMPMAEVASIELSDADSMWHEKEVVVSGVLSKENTTWIINNPHIEEFNN